MTLFFHWDLTALRQYEEHTGNNFFDDYKKSMKILNSAVSSSKSKNNENNEDNENENKNSKNNNKNDENKNNENKTELIDILYDDCLNKFFINLIPCLYLKEKDGIIIKNDITYEDALSSDWLLNLLNIKFISKVIEEINKNQMENAENNKSNKNNENNNKNNENNKNNVKKK